jgi:hypothetical protein
MRFGWSGWRQWPPWLVVYIGVVCIAGSVVVVLLGLGALFASPTDWLGGLIGVGLGVLLMAAGVRMITAQLADE